MVLRPHGLSPEIGTEPREQTMFKGLAISMTLIIAGMLGVPVLMLQLV